MKNLFFPDEDITEDDLMFVCYMIERTARRIKQPNKYVVNKMGRHNLHDRLSVANVQHCENPEDVVDQWIEYFGLENGTHNVTDVNPNLCDIVPSALQIGKVYWRLILAVKYSDEDYVDTIERVYNNPICEVIDNYNGSAYYEPSYCIARAFNEGSFNGV